MPGARFAGVLADNLRNALFEKVGQSAARQLAGQVFRHIHELSLRFHLERRTGSLTKIVERGTKSIDMMLYFLLFNIGPTLIELAAICVIFWVKFGPGLVAATLAMVAVYIAFTRFVTDWRAQLQREMNEVDNRAIGRAVDIAAQLRNGQIFRRRGARGEALRRGDHAIHPRRRAQRNLARLAQHRPVADHQCDDGGRDGLHRLGLEQGPLHAGRRGAGQCAADAAVPPARHARLGLSLDPPGADRHGSDVRACSTRRPRSSTGPARRRSHVGAGPRAVRRRPLRLRAAGARSCDGLDLDIPAGTSCAIVGPSGAGKSTIARLLYRFYDPSAGPDHHRRPGHRRRSRQASLRAAIGIVPQDTVLFNDTIGYNIAYGRDGATQADVEAAARGAAIDGFIAMLPDGYESMVGERGLKLSGGEKQRVAIARTLLKNPPILVLDEATSALDSRTEQAIQETLDRIAESRTTIIIAHRLSTIVDADQIVVLDQGRVVERGTHDQLLARGGLYAELWARQAAERSDRSCGGGGGMTGDPATILKSVFGFHGFRGVQEQVVDRVMAGEHTLAVMPTGRRQVAVLPAPGARPRRAPRWSSRR